MILFSRIMKFSWLVCAFSVLSSVLFTSSASAIIDFYNSRDFNNFTYSSSGTTSVVLRQTNFLQVTLSSGSNVQVYNPTFSFPGLNVDNGTQFKFDISGFSTSNVSLLCPTSTLSYVVDNCDFNTSRSFNVSNASFNSSVGLIRADFSQYSTSSLHIEGHYNGSSSLTWISSVAFSGSFLVNNNNSSNTVLFFSPISFYRDKTDNSIQSALGAQTDAINNGFNQQHKDNQVQLDESKKQTEEQKKQTAVMEQTKDFVTDTKQPDAGDIANADSIPSVGLLPSGPIDSLLLLPLNIMNSITSSLGGTCSPIVAPLPFSNGQKLTFPCFGDTLYKGDFAILATLVGSVASALILYGYFKHLYKKVDRATSLESNDEDEWCIL